MTVRMKLNVITRYFLLYSTVQSFSPGNGCLWCFLRLSAISSSVNGRAESPSRYCAGHHVDCGRVKLDRFATLEPRPGDDAEAPVPPVFAAATTFDPKNLRSSASLSRCCSETARRVARDRAAPGAEVGAEASCCLRSGYFIESSASARSTSSMPSSACFSFAFCFFRALRSFFDGPVRGCGVDGAGSSSGTGVDA